MTEERDRLLAADADRQAVADRLRKAADEGRLTLSEYDERLRDAYAARTYGELDQVVVDLPGPRPVEASGLAVPADRPAAPRRAGRDEVDPELGDDRSPGQAGHGWASRWRGWGGVLGLNVAIWALVSASAGHPVYFWPMWLAIPTVAMLLFGTGRHGDDPHRDLERRRAARAQARATMRARRRQRRGRDW